MKKILLFLLLILALFSTIQVSAEPIIVTVSEDLSELGINCGEAKSKSGKATGYYDCEIEKGFSSIQIMLGKMIQYSTFLILLTGVLFMVINGIIYSIGGEDKSGAKERITKCSFGMLVLAFLAVILNAIAPWVYVI